jgi:hypothetical protein
MILIFSGSNRAEGKRISSHYYGNRQTLIRKIGEWFIFQTDWSSWFRKIFKPFRGIVEVSMNFILRGFLYSGDYQ